MARDANGTTWSAAVVATCCLLVLCVTLATGDNAGQKKALQGSKPSVWSSAGGPLIKTSSILVKEAVASTSDARAVTRGQHKRVPQVLEEEYVTVATTVKGSAATTMAGAGGRKLKALGDRCNIYVKNMCKSKKAFQVSFGYYTKNGVDSGYLRGWEAQGWYNIKYGQTLSIYGFQTLYLIYSNKQRLTNTVDVGTFCASPKPYQILEGDDGYYYYSKGDYYYKTTTCAKAGGKFVGGWYAPKYCGRTYVSKTC